MSNPISILDRAADLRNAYQMLQQHAADLRQAGGDSTGGQMFAADAMQHAADSIEVALRAVRNASQFMRDQTKAAQQQKGDK